MTDEPIVVAFSVRLPELHLLAPSPPHTYMGVAHAMYMGVTALATMPSPPALPLALLAAHTLECGLKAYLSRNGDDTRVTRDSHLRHNLDELWALASDQGLEVPHAPPPWVTCLSLVHNKPYHLRYSGGVHGISTPSPEPMTTELGALLGQVDRQLHT